MAVSLRRETGGRGSVRTMVMTAEVSSRWVGCRVAGVGVAILKAFLSGGGLSEPSRGARARLPELRTATSIANRAAPYAPPTANTKGILSQNSYIPFPAFQVVLGRAIPIMSGAANRQGKMVSKSAQQLDSLT